jgi:hypothetical protein
MVPGSIGPVEEYDEKTRIRTPAVDKLTGERVWSLRVIDLDPEIGTRPRETVVKLTAPVQPVPPSGEVCSVEFDGLTVTPYVNDKGRIAFSLRATGLKPPTTAKARPDESKAA